MPMTTARRGDHARVAVDAEETELAEAAGQVDERSDHGQDRADGRGDVEGPVDRGQAALAGARRGEVDAEHGGDRADGGDDQREDQALGAEDGRAQDQRGDQGHGVGLEEVGGHAGAVTHVVAHVVGDGGGVARVVLGDVVLDLADEVGADVGGLGEDAAADAHEHGQQRGAEAEALEHLGGLVAERDHDDRGAEEAEAHGQHADEGTGAEADLHGRVAAHGVRGSGHAQVGLHGQGHAQVADRRGEAGTDQEEQRPEDPHADVVGGQRQQRHEGDHGEDGERPELALEVGVGALLHRMGDVLHVVGALSCREDLRAEHHGHPERAEGDQEDDDDQHEVSAAEVNDERVEPGHDSPRELRLWMTAGESTGIRGSAVTGFTRRADLFGGTRQGHPRGVRLRARRTRSRGS